MSNQFLSNIKAAFGIGTVKLSTTGEQKVVRETSYSRVKKEEHVAAFDAVDKRYNEFVNGFKDVADAAPLSEGLAIVRDLTQEVINEEVALASTKKAEERQRKILNAFDKIEAQQGLLATSVLAKQARIADLEAKINERATLVETRSKEVGQRLTLQELAARAAAKTPALAAGEIVIEAPKTVVKPPKQRAVEPIWSESQLKMIDALTKGFNKMELAKGINSKGLAINVTGADNKTSALACLKQMSYENAVKLVDWLTGCNYRKDVWASALAALPAPKATKEVNTLPEPIKEEVPSDEVPSKKELESVLKDSTQSVSTPVNQGNNVTL